MLFHLLLCAYLLGFVLTLEVSCSLWVSVLCAKGPVGPPEARRGSLAIGVLSQSGAGERGRAVRSPLRFLPRDYGTYGGGEGVMSLRKALGILLSQLLQGPLLPDAALVPLGIPPLYSGQGTFCKSPSSC